MQARGDACSVNAIWPERLPQASPFLPDAAPGEQKAKAIQDDDRLAFLVFRCHAHLIAHEGEKRPVWGKLNRVPIDRDLAAADAEKTAEINERRADIALVVDQNVNDAPHVFASDTIDLAAEDGFDVLVVENCRRSRILGGSGLCRRGGGLGCLCRRRFGLRLLRRGLGDSSDTRRKDESGANDTGYDGRIDSVLSRPRGTAMRSPPISFGQHGRWQKHRSSTGAKSPPSPQDRPIRLT